MKWISIKTQLPEKERLVLLYSKDIHEEYSPERWGYSLNWWYQVDPLREEAGIIEKLLHDISGGEGRSWASFRYLSQYAREDGGSRELISPDLENIYWTYLPEPPEKDKE